MSPCTCLLFVLYLCVLVACIHLSKVRPKPKRQNVSPSSGLIQASLYSRVDVVRVLLKAGADKDATDRDGTTALMLASMPPSRYFQLDSCRVPSVFKSDVSSKPLTRSARELDESYTCILVGTDIMNDFHFAPREIRTGHAEIVHMLLQAGADRNLVSKDGTTAMMEATSWGHIEVMGLLKPRKRKRETLA